MQALGHWSLVLNTRNSVDCAYIDVSKAFDSVVHSKLCVKLALFGIVGNLLKWISSFLHDRTRCTKVGNCQSSLSKVISGVPQGSVLGPLLFRLFINNLPSLFGDGMTVKMFADDMYLVVNDINNSSVLECGLCALFDWSLKWQLSVSAKNV